MILGFVGIGVVILTWIVAHYISWFWPRVLQHVQKFITYPLSLMTLNRLTPSQHYTEKDISPRFWPNGKMPVREDWKQLAKGGFQEYRLKVGGLVDNPVELSLADIARLGVVENITMHHCIQGWTGIAKWGGLPMKSLIELVRPKPNAKVVAFFSFGDSLYGGGILRHSKPGKRAQGGVPARLGDEWKAPDRGLRSALALRVENQLGYKMVKWIERIEFIESEKTVGLGEGGKNEDDEYFDLLPNI